MAWTLDGSTANELEFSGLECNIDEDMCRALNEGADSRYTTEDNTPHNALY